MRSCHTSHCHDAKTCSRHLCSVDRLEYPPSFKQCSLTVPIHSGAFGNLQGSATLTAERCTCQCRACSVRPCNAVASGLSKRGKPRPTLCLPPLSPLLQYLVVQAPALPGLCSLLQKLQRLPLLCLGHSAVLTPAHARFSPLH